MTTNRNKARLGIESLETRDCPSGLSTAGLFHWGAVPASSVLVGNPEIRTWVGDASSAHKIDPGAISGAQVDFFRPASIPVEQVSDVRGFSWGELKQAPAPPLTLDSPDAAVATGATGNPDTAIRGCSNNLSQAHTVPSAVITGAEDRGFSWGAVKIDGTQPYSAPDASRTIGTVDNDLSSVEYKLFSPAPFTLGGPDTVGDPEQITLYGASLS